MRSVTRGERPPRLEEPSLTDDAWKLIQDCWSQEKIARPAMEDVVERLMRHVGAGVNMGVGVTGAISVEELSDVRGSDASEPPPRRRQVGGFVSRVLMSYRSVNFCFLEGR